MNSDKLIGLTLLTTIFLFVMTFHVQEVVAQNLRICESGLQACEKHILDKSLYKECIKQECNQKNTKPRNYFDLTDEFESIELIETCDYGLRRCESLSGDKLAFWECVRQSCENQPESYDATCKKGQKQCTRPLRIYNNCVAFSCPRGEDGKIQQCPKGKRDCEGALRKYWQCVYGRCLGDVGIYRLNKVYRKYIRVKDSAGNIVKIRIDKEPPTLAGVPKNFINPPEGVNREEWVRDIPSRYLLVGNPVKSLTCFRPSQRIKCYTRDMRSCICSDGSIPVFKNGPPKPIYQEEWEANED